MMKFTQSINRIIDALLKVNDDGFL